MGSTWKRHAAGVMIVVLSAVLVSCRRVPIREVAYYPGTAGALPEAPVARVAISVGATQATLGCNGPYRIVGEPGERLISSGNRLKELSLQASTNGFMLGDESLNANRFKITPARGGSLSFKGERYRGSFRVVATGRREFDVVNLVDLEEYIAGVLGSEVPLDWPDRCLRAQAIVARSYAVFQMKDRKGQPYDLKSTVQDQAYLGMRRETSKARQIVKETRGIVLLYKWRFFPTYFHSTCGGHTEDVKNVFSSESIPPLQGVKCGFCTESKYYTWTSTVSAEDVRKRLSGRIGTGRVRTIEPLDFSNGGRARKVRVSLDQKAYDIDGTTFRRLLGSNVLRSTNFRVRRTGSNFIFTGKGWGHGVGMCQFGARGMAKKKYDCIDIIWHYYPQVQFARIY